MNESMHPLKVVFLLIFGLMMLYVFLIFFGGVLTECVLNPNKEIGFGECTIDKVNFAFNSGFDDIEHFRKRVWHFLSSNEGLYCQEYKEPEM